MASNRLTGQRAWFADARFGVFVHFGLYTLLGENENTCREGRTPLEYERHLMPLFNPQRFNADQWVRLIRDAGATYIVLTTKHGEGFCLWDTQHTRFKITNTPFKRDLVGEIAEAAHKHGLRLGLYFASDNWHYQEPGEGTAEARTYPGYVEAQLRELLTRYGRVDEIWLDGKDARLTVDIVRNLIDMIHTLQPTAVVNNRAVDMSKHSTCLLGDFATPERMIPESLGPGAPFIECCDAMGVYGWGYYKGEHFWSVPEMIRRLSRVACMGGNYLLNIEPQPDGEIRPECVDRLRLMGRWIAAHRQALFGVTPSPLIPLDTGVDQLPKVVGPLPVVGMSCARGSAVYFHLHHWPDSDEVFVRHVRGKPIAAKLLGSDAALHVNLAEDGLHITGLPPEPPTTSVAVVQVDFAEPPTIDQAAIEKDRRIVTRVPPGETVNLLPETSTRYGTNGINWPRINRFANGNVAVGYMAYLECAVQWHLDVAQPGRYQVFADLGTCSLQKDAVFTITIADQTLTAKTVENGWYDQCQRMNVGTVSLPVGPAVLDLKIREMPRAFSDTHRIVLQPVR
ncbi:MAG: alpha-L-fucosidase [Phycisphaerales bacterium]